MAAAVLALATSEVRGQDGVPITGDRISGVVIPIEPLAGDIDLQALRAWAWDVDDTKRLLLEGDVSVRVGGYWLNSDSAVVWLNRIPSADGLINQLAVYFDRVTEPTSRAGVGVSGQGLLVTASARGRVELGAALLTPGRPRHEPAGAMLARAEARMSDYLSRILGGQPTLGRRPQIDSPPQPPAFVPQPGGTIEPVRAEPPRAGFIPAMPDASSPLFVPQGVIRFTAGRTELVPGEQENVVLLTGQVVVEYDANDAAGQWSQLSLTAERAVVFTAPGSVEQMASGRLDIAAVRGVYLEGGVIVTASQSGAGAGQIAAGDPVQYVARAPRAYYDVQHNSAIMLDAVLRTYSRRTNLPVYARALELRQVAANQWQARKIVVSASEFFTPHLAIGAQRLTLTRRPDQPDAAAPDAPIETFIDSEVNTLRLGGVPFFVWPRFAGKVQDVPLRQIRVGTADNNGVEVQTTWDPISLLGLERPDWVQRALLRVDAYTERGGGVGGELAYHFGRSSGVLDLYGLYDDGIDRTSSGLEVSHEDELRGVALWEHQLRLDPFWTLQAQVSYISDETFITTWREDDFVARREYETSLYLKRQERNRALTILAQYDLNDFVSNDWLLASRALSVDRLPDVSYRRYGDSIFGDRVTYSSETRVTRSRLRFTRRTPAELGVPGAAFGLPSDVQISDAFLAAGFESGYSTRFDTRHEFAIPMQLGAVKLVPFFVGRITAYSEGVESFSSDTDKHRAFGAAGLRINTQITRVRDDVESRLLDLHRLRHIIEPSVTLWYGHSTVDQSDLPVYDVEVESLATGAAIEVAVRNTWQTKRGGPGRWRSVNVFTLDTSVVFNGSDADPESPAARFFDYRPEYSQFGDHARWAAVWNVSDALALTGENLFDLEQTVLARASFGAELRHSPDLTTFIEYRSLDASDNQLLDVEWQCRLTPKYELALRPQWDFVEDKFRSFRVRLIRSFPDFDFIAQVEYDDIRNDTSIGASLGRVEF